MLDPNFTRQLEQILVQAQAGQQQAPMGASPAVPGADLGLGQRLGLMDPNGALNFQNLGAISQGLAGLGSLWGGMQQRGLAKDALNFQKETYATNLRNSTQAYNTSLEDRARARHAMEGSRGKLQGYLDKHKL